MRSATIDAEHPVPADLRDVRQKLAREPEPVTAAQIDALEEAIAELAAERARLERVEEPLRDQARLTDVHTQLAELREVVAGARRQRAIERLTGYARRRQQIDRAQHLSVVLGDVMAMCVEAQLAADDHNWESACETLKGAKARLSDGCNLTKLVNDLALAHSPGGQLALSLE